MATVEIEQNTTHNTKLLRTGFGAAVKLAVVGIGLGFMIASILPRWARRDMPRRDQEQSKQQ